MFEAEDVKLGRRVAIKTIRGERFSGDALKRLEAEARALAELSHPGIVRVHEWGELRGLPFLAMEYVDGETLSGRLKRGPLAPADAAVLAQQLARALEHVHTRGLLHRDVKPSNIVLEPAGESAGDGVVLDSLEGKRWKPRLIDFGLTKRQEAAEELSRAGGLVGTPAYVSPEQAEGRVDLVGPRSDLYGLGAVLYHCLTGQPPFPPTTDANTLQMIRHVEPPNPRLFNRGIARDLETVCLKCLRKEPARRYQTAGELADDLGRFLAGRPIVARAVSRVEKLWRWAGRNRKLASALAAVAGLLLAVACLSTWYAWREARLLAMAEAEASRANGLVEDALAGFKTAAKGFLLTGFNLREVDSGAIQESVAREVRKDLAASLRKLVEDFRKNPELVQRHPDWLVELLYARSILAKDAEDTAGEAEADQQLLEILAGIEKLPRLLVTMELEVALKAGDRSVLAGKMSESLALWQGVWFRHLNLPDDGFPFTEFTLKLRGQLKDRLLCAMLAGGDDQDGAARLLLQWEALKGRLEGKGGQ